MNLGYLIRIIPFKLYFVLESITFFLVPSLPLFLKVDDASKTEPIVRFVPIMLFSRQVHLLLNENGGRLLFANFESSYLERFGVQCRPSAYGHSSIISLLQSILHLVVIRGKGPRRVLTLHREMAGKNLFLFLNFTSCLNRLLR